MKYSELGKTGIQVSKICLGTMNFGEQNTEADAHQQLSYSVEQGINFIDTAEMYPVPTRKETKGLTEQYIGTWLKKTGLRNKLVIATKAAGPGDWIKYVRGGPDFSEQHLTEALEGSLRLLQTDYIDLYQLHWPERATNFFGKLGYQHPENEAWQYNFVQVLQTLHKFVQQGKIRYIGVSNETAWGVMSWLRESERHGLPRVASIQNPYNLLNRSFEVGLAEVAIRENVKLLAYSPMAFGLLSGKFENGQKPPQARITLYPRMSRYNGEPARKAASRYVALAKEHGLSPAQMSLAYINSRPFLCANIIGATTMEQLRENIESINVQLSPDVLKGIENIHAEASNPAP